MIIHCINAFAAASEIKREKNRIYAELGIERAGRNL